MSALALMWLATAPVSAPAAPIELWNGFTTASTVAQIKAFKADKPKKRIEIVPGCFAYMGYRVDQKQIVTITFMGQDKEADCFARMFADLRSKLGKPETDTTTFGGGFAYGTAAGVTMVDTSSVGIVYIWRDGEKKTKIVKSPGDGYNLIFTVRPDKYIY